MLVVSHCGSSGGLHLVFKRLEMVKAHIDS